MKVAILIISFMFYCLPAALPQARPDHKMKPQRFRSKVITFEEKEEDKKIDPKTQYNLNERGNEIDEFFYLKWSKDRKLNFGDFKYDKSFFKQLIPEKDTDLLHSVYPSYQAFYNTLNKRIERDSSLVVNKQDSINHRLNAKLDSMYAGLTYAASVDMNISFEKNIDSPAASALMLSPGIYAVNDTMFYYNIVALFSKYESWMVIKSKDILQHEQIHFDIFELYARKLRKYWTELLKKQYTGMNIYDITDELAPVYDQLYQQLYQKQLDFDEQTSVLTSTNASLSQLNARWEVAVRAELDSLSEFSNPEGTVILR